jgi:DNA-binding MarR family transcriptional regulator
MTAPVVSPRPPRSDLRAAKRPADPAPPEDADEARPGASPLQLGPLGEIVGFHLARAAVNTVDAFERHIGAPFALRKVEFSLLMLLRTNRPVAPKQLLQALSLTAPKLTILVDGLEQRGLLRRERNPADGRSRHLVLTERGRRLAEDTAAAAGPMEQELLERLTRAEHAMLIELLGKLAER